MAIPKYGQTHLVRCQCGTRLNIERVESDHYQNLTILYVDDHICVDRDGFRATQLADAEARAAAAELELKHYKDFMKMMKGVA